MHGFWARLLRLDTRSLTIYACLMIYASSPVKNVTVDNKQNCVLIGADSHSKHSQGDANDDV